MLWNTTERIERKRKKEKMGRLVTWVVWYGKIIKYFSKTKLSIINALKYKINTYHIFHFDHVNTTGLGRWKLLLQDRAIALQAWSNHSTCWYARVVFKCCSCLYRMLEQEFVKPNITLKYKYSWPPEDVNSRWFSIRHYIHKNSTWNQNKKLIAFTLTNLDSSEKPLRSH